MSLNNILDTIKKDAERQTDEIREENDKKIAGMKKEFVGKIEILKEKMLERATIQANKKVEQEQFRAKNVHSSSVLSEKQSVLDDIFVQAAGDLAKLDNNKQLELLKTLIEALPDGEGEIRSTEASSDLVAKAVSGHKVSSKTVEGVGGFVFISSSVEIDNRYETLVQLSRDGVETQVAEILFS